jgi:hypothetical protein
VKSSAGTLTEATFAKLCGSLVKKISTFLSKAQPSTVTLNLRLILSQGPLSEFHVEYLSFPSAAPSA